MKTNNQSDSGRTLYIFNRWALCRQLETIDAAERWLDGVTGAGK
jgi:hypothetical protein